jgi:predicted dehydrogenase
MAPILKVGIIGAGEVAQVIHLPTLSLLTHLYQMVAICDVSGRTAAHCAQKFHIPRHTTDPDEIIHDAAVDVVFILTSDEFHAVYAVAALQAGKSVMIEKPLTLSLPAAHRIVEAERSAPGKVFVGYMRRYAPAFTRAFQREVASIPKILYARVRDFPGPNAAFVSQSGTYAVRHNDVPSSAGEERNRLLGELFGEAFAETGLTSTDETQKFCRFLGSLGSHDLSLMRETLGFPESVAGVSVNDPFYTAIFNYKDKHGNPFAVTYESGIDEVQTFDAHIAVYGARKRVWIQYDTPYVKGLPIHVRVEEINEHGEKQLRDIVSSYEDAYTAELLELYACMVDGKPIKTTAEDAMNDLRLYDLMYRQHAASR